MESLNALRSSSNVVTDIAKNDYVIAIVALLAIAYAGTFAPKLPNKVSSVLDNIIVKFVIFFVIAYVISRKVDVALISSLAVLALVLGLQVYLSDAPEKGSHMEKMTGGFQPILGGKQADITINNGNFMENEPLNESWTQKTGEVQGYSLDWPGYENAGNDVQSVSTTSVSAPSVATPSIATSVSSGSSEVVPINDKHNEPADGEIVGVSATDMSGLARV